LHPCDEPSELQMARIEEGIWARASHRARPSQALRLALAVLALVAGVASVKAYELARRAGWLDRIHGLPPAQPARPQPSKRSVRAVTSAPALPASTFDPAAMAQAPVALGVAPIQAPEPVASEPPRRQARAARREAVVEIPASTLAPTTKSRDPFEPAPTDPAAGRSAEDLPARVSAPARPLPPSVPASGPSQEIHALDGAIALLRRDHDAAAALTAFDAYLERYPHGVLHREARLARLDALLILKRTDEAMAELETLSLDSGRRSAELQVVRAELRARTNCLRAEEDFSVALTHSPDTALLERILYGRGACRAKSGKVSGAAEDLRRYLERFPTGAHAQWARQWLNASSTAPVKGG
jgi:TolA-binding protein